MPEATEFRYTDEGSETVVYREDCISGMQQRVEPDSVDVVVTSPPYNLGIAYKSYDDSKPRIEYLDWIEAWGRAVRRVLRESGSLFLNIAGKPSDPWVPFEVLQRLKDVFVLQNTFHWIKSIALDAHWVGSAHGLTRNRAFGHYKPINSKRFVNDCHEYIFHLTPTGNVELDRLAIGVEYQDKSNVARWAGAKEDRRCRGNTWFIPYQTIQSRDRERPHPAAFPIRIPLMCIRLHGLSRVQCVLDPFLGLGHTALACKVLKVPCIGFEMDPGYFSEACRQIRAFDPVGVDHPNANQLRLF